MAVSPSGDPQERLVCGTRLDDLAEQITEQVPPADPQHQAGCEYCQAALAGLDRGWADVRAFTATPVPRPAGLSGRILREVRSLAARHDVDLDVAGERGQTRIAAAVLAQIARRAALAVPGVVLASTLEVRADAQIPAGVWLSLRLVVDFGPDLQELGTAVRGEIAEHLRGLAGVSVSGVDVLVEDVVGFDLDG